MKHKWCCLLFVLCIFLCGCSDITENQPNQYGKWNEITLETLASKSFRGFLPIKGIVDAYGETYYYRYEQAMLGDPNFVITVTAQLSDEDVLGEETDRLEEAAEFSVLQGNKTYLFARKEVFDSWISEYLDDRIYDGMYYSLEIAVVEDSGRITYVSARVWDYYRNDVLSDFLNQMIESIPSLKSETTSAS